MALTTTQASIAALIQSNPTLYGPMTAAQLATAIATQVPTPRTSPVTYATLSSATCLGVSATVALQTWLQSTAAGNTSAAPLAKLADTLLSGAGFNAADPEVAGAASQLVAAGALTQTQATLALNTLAYPIAGMTSAATADIEAAQAYVALANAQATITAQWQNVYKQGIALISAATTAATVPTLATLQALTPN